MSRLTSALGALCVGAALAPPAVAALQATPIPQTVEELRSYVESRRGELAAAKVAADEAGAARIFEEAARGRVPTDTIHVGPLTIVTLPDQRELAEELFSEVWAEHFELISGSPTLAEELFTFQWQPRAKRIFIDPEGPNAVRVEMLRFIVPTRAIAKDRIRNAIGSALMQRELRGTPVSKWATGAHSPTYERAYRAFASWPARAHQACLAGEVDACWAALGLEIHEADLEAWFTPAERVQMVRRDSWNTLDRDLPVVRRCSEDEHVPSCDEAIRAHLTWVDRYGHPRAPKASLFWFAIERGGEGVWERVLENRDEVPQVVLARASGMEAEALVTAWRDELMQHRPDVHAGLGGTRWAVLFWTLLLAAFAMRSTRWRLG